MRSRKQTKRSLKGGGDEFDDLKNSIGTPITFTLTTLVGGIFSNKTTEIIKAIGVNNWDPNKILARSIKVQVMNPNGTTSEKTLQRSQLTGVDRLMNIGDYFLQQNPPAMSPPAMSPPATSPPGSGNFYQTKNVGGRKTRRRKRKSRKSRKNRKF
jgi:hypothetical protein